VLIECYQQRIKAAARIVLLAGGRVALLPWLDATASEVTAFPGIMSIGMPPAAEPEPRGIRSL
jgi:hypothetical protein